MIVRCLLPLHKQVEHKLNVVHRCSNEPLLAYEIEVSNEVHFEELPCKMDTTSRLI